VAFDALMADLGLAALATPAGGWETVETAIRAGLAREEDAEAARVDAEAALRLGQPRQAITVLARFSVTELPPPVALPLVQVREQAMEQLALLGQGSPDALATVRAQRQALEAALADEQRES
jgi:pilus assembly protein CpaF